MLKYTQEWSKDKKHVKVIDRETKYSLHLCHVVDGPFHCFHTTFNSDSANSNLFITGRGIEDYDPDIVRHVLNPNYQYIEVGAGLGEFTPRLVEIFGNKINNRPVVIDPANYDVLNGLLDFALTLDLGPKMRGTLNCLNSSISA